MQQQYAAYPVQKNGPAASALRVRLPRSLVRNPDVSILCFIRPCTKLDSSPQSSVKKLVLVQQQPCPPGRNSNMKIWNGPQFPFVSPPFSA
ncbi:hypothetical protein KY290_033423 [Solanum tuberosum]|uniref:Uncharacterized protein n=1 Tax=Solanum tuberosum TaxID=4113 RepID=A0ABQ7U0H7_SOLTU|nr:hypothetical protein KY285_032673 [Solanum tuberosum]KAH0740380.1 hypothetical protein KY290_033423 [Solanum tuberosum]